METGIRSAPQRSAIRIRLQTTLAVGAVRPAEEPQQEELRQVEPRLEERQPAELQPVVLLPAIL